MYIYYIHIHVCCVGMYIYIYSNLGNMRVLEGKIKAKEIKLTLKLSELREAFLN